MAELLKAFENLALRAFPAVGALGALSQAAARSHQGGRAGVCRKFLDVTQKHRSSAFPSTFASMAHFQLNRHGDVGCRNLSQAVELSFGSASTAC